MTPSERWFLRAGTVFTAKGETIQDGVIEIEHDRILGVSTARALEENLSRPGVAVIEYPDATALPGLIDAHCHITLSGNGKTYAEQERHSDEMMALIAVNNLARHLRSGVTTVRDNGGRNLVSFHVREAAQEGLITAPRMLLAGRPLTHSNGHFCWCNGVADTPDEIRTAVRRLVAEGADHIKLMASGGGTIGSNPYFASYGVDELRVAVQVAHGLGRLTTAHCRAASSMVNAIRAGSDCIEHGEFLVPSPAHRLLGSRSPSGVIAYDSKIVGEMLESHTFLSFTAQAGGWATLLQLRALAQDKACSEEERLRLDALERMFDDKMKVLSQLIADGMLPQIAISTDAGPGDVAFGTLQYGLTLAVQAGMTPAEAITAATATAARLCGIADEVGSLDHGLAADIVVVRGDPTTNIAAMWEVDAVYKGGALVVPSRSVTDIHAPGL